MYWFCMIWTPVMKELIRKIKSLGKLIFKVVALRCSKCAQNFIKIHGKATVVESSLSKVAGLRLKHSKKKHSIANVFL